MWELDHKESWAPKNWCFWTMVLEKTFECPSDSKKIKSVNPKGNQPWTFTGRADAEVKAPIHWPPNVKRWLIGQDPDAGKDWGKEEKGATEDDMVGWHLWLNGHEFEKLQEIVEDKEARCAAVYGGRKSWTWLSNWTITNTNTASSMNRKYWKDEEICTKAYHHEIVSIHRWRGNLKRS